MNKVIILGNITRDIELRTVGSSCVADIGIAMNEKYKNKAGEVVEKAHFVDVVAWGRKAEVIAEYFHKGSKILVEGSLDFDQWENEAGEKRSKLRVKLFNFDFVDSKGEGTATPPSDNAYGTATPPASAKPSGAAPQSTFDDDDIPF